MLFLMISTRRVEKQPKRSASGPLYTKVRSLIFGVVELLITLVLAKVSHRQEL